MNLYLVNEKTRFMRNLLFIVLLASSTVSAQVANFQNDFNKINEGLMVTLGSYAVSNFAVSGAGYFLSEDESTKRFHQMNVMWNTVNLGLAVPGYIKARRNAGSFSREEMRAQQRKTEQIFLINTGLDLGYIAAGYYMRNDAVNRGDREALFRGYGNSLLLQGGFLFAFDLVAFGIHRAHFNRDFERLSNRISIYPMGGGVGLVLKLD